ncbi:MAG: PAS domain S-box protein, partial [Mariprofundaceae bacterium]|nr:PAS domain S-box protein [Mariprofundaceae bacterium]
GYNQRFVDMWHLPEELVQADDDEQAIAHVLGQLQDPDGFADRVKALYASPEANSFDEIHFRDGRVFERYSIPQRLDGTIVGRVWNFRDVSALRENEARLEELAAYAENNPAPVMKIDASGIVLDANPAAMVLFGAGLIGSPVQQIPGLGDLEPGRYIEEGRQVIRSGTISHITYHWVIKGITSLDIAHIYGSNISELKWIKEHIHDSPDDLQKILDANPLPTIVTRLSDGTMFYANHATTDMLGIHPKDIVAQKTLDFFARPDEREGLMQELVKHGRIDNRELQIKNPDGRLFWTSASLKLLEFEQEQCVLATFFDLSEVKEHERALMESEKRYRDLVEVLPDALVLHQNGSVVFANTQAAELFGDSKAQQAVAAHAGLAAHIHPDSMPLATQRIQTLMRGEPLHAAADEKMLRRDGSSFDAEVRIALSDFRGKPAILGSIRDVSQRKLAERRAVMHNRVLSAITESQPLAVTLGLLAECCEHAHPGLRATILLRRGQRLYSGAGPSMDPAYNKAVDGLEIGPTHCTCGSAAFHAQRIVSSNLASDPNWAKARNLVREHDLKACWSEPVLDNSGEVLGTFALFPDAARDPSKDEIISIESAAKLAALAIERAENEATVLRLTQSVEQAAEAIIIADPRDRIEYVNHAFTRITGYSADEVMGRRTTMNMADDQDEGFYREMFRHVLAGKPWQVRVHCKRKNGEEYTAQVSAAGVRDKAGRLIQMAAVYEDLTPYIELEEQLRQAQKMEA